MTDVDRKFPIAATIFVGLMMVWVLSANRRHARKWLHRDWLLVVAGLGKVAACIVPALSGDTGWL